MDRWGKGVVRAGLVALVGTLVVSGTVTAVSPPAAAGGFTPEIDVVPEVTSAPPGQHVDYSVEVHNTAPTPITVTEVTSLQVVCRLTETVVVDPDDEEVVGTCRRHLRPSDVPQYPGVVVDVTVAGLDPFTSPASLPVDVAFPDHGFSDVDAGASFAEAVRWARFFDLVAGFSDGTFRAQNKVTRGQVVNMLWHTVDEPVVNRPHGFRDVPAGAFYRQALNWAKARGLVTGFAGNRYRPKQAVTRGQLLNMVHKMVRSPSLLPGGGPGYSDVTGGFRTAARWARQHELAHGFAPGTTLNPTRSARRGEVVDVLHRLVERSLAWQRWDDRRPVSTWTFDDAHVLIRGREYVVAWTTVLVGESVTWEMVDTGKGTLHTVTNDDIGLNEQMGQQDVRTVAFEDPGDFVYHCLVHPGMEGRVTVAVDS